MNSRLSNATSPVNGMQPADLLARITSHVPTRYRLVEDDGNAVIHVYCALDTIEYAIIAGGSFRVFGNPPAGPAIRLSLTPAGPEPGAAWMSAVICGQIAQLPEVGGMPSRCCPYVHFFASQEAYAAWNKELPNTVRPHIECISLSEAWQRARKTLAACGLFSCDCQSTSRNQVSGN